VAPYFTNLICFKQVQIAHKSAVKKSFNATLKLEELEKLSFSKADFSALDWDGDDEFYLSNKKYDLYQLEQKGDSIIAWAWWDHKEAELEKRFHQMLHRNKNEPLKNKPEIGLDKLSKYLANHSYNSMYFASADEYSGDYSLKLCQAFIAVDSPPPLLF